MPTNKNLPAYRKLDQLVAEGRAQLCATATDAINISFPKIIEPGEGQVAIITKLMCTGFRSDDTSTPYNPPSTEILGFNVLDRDSNVLMSAKFVAFKRWDDEFANPNSPNWQSAIPFAPMVIDFEDPLVIPPNCFLISSELGSLSINDMAGMNWMARGYVIASADARALGFNVPEFPDNYSSPADYSLKHGLAGAEVTDSAVALIAGRTGQHLRITRIIARQQQWTHAPNITWSIRQTDDTMIFKGCNNNPSDFAEWNFPCDIILPDGQGIELIGDTGVRATVTIQYEFVNPEEVPDDAWWAYLAPDHPTPGEASVGLNGLYTTGGDELQCYYPGRDATAASAGTGKQHILRGYAIAAQKDAVVASDEVFFALTSGTSAGSLGLAGGTTSITTTNTLLTTMFGLGSHDQVIYFSESDLTVYCPANESLWMDFTATGDASNSPQQADLGIAHLAVLAWGKTVPTRLKSTQHFQGEAGQ